MILPKEDIEFFFGPGVQARNRRRLNLGDLREVINCRQVVEEAYEKRFGFDRAVPTVESGSFTTPAESFISDGKSLLARDGGNVVWKRDGVTWRSRGTVKRALPALSPGNLVPSASRSYAVAVGTNYWVFTVASGAYRFTIYDASGNITRSSTTVTAASISQLAAATDGTYVWVLWITGASTTVTSHRITIASPGTAPTSATYQTLTVNSKGVDMHRLASGDIAVAITEWTAGSSGRLTVSYLDPATGQADAAPASVSSVLGIAVGGNPSMGPPSILTSDGSNGSWYVAYWVHRTVTFGGDGASQNLQLATITASNLATAGVTLANASDAAAVVLGFASGYLAGNGDRVVFASSDTYTGTPTQPRPYVLTRYTYNGATTPLVLRRYSYPVSKPQQIGSSWYLLTGFDDGSTTDFLKSYFLTDSDGNILTQIAYGQAAAPGMQADKTISLAAGRGFTTPLHASGNKLFAGVLLNTGSGGGASGVNDYAPALLTCDLAAAWAPPRKWKDGQALWPGGVPVRAGTQDDQREIALMLSPVNATFTAGGGAALAGPTVVQYVYRMVDADGTIYRSSPSPAQTQTFNNGAGAQVIVKPLTHMLPGATAQIEVYLSEANDVEPFLHTVVDNDPTVDTITVAVTPATIATDQETIYTFGGGVENAPVPAARAVGWWRGRTVVMAGSEIWPSLDEEEGLGPRFNEAAVTLWRDGEGDILAGAEIDWNYYAVFKKNTIAVISGAGPSPTPGGGIAGNFETQTLTVKKGDINTRSIVTGAQGVYFQSRADMRIYCATAGLQVLDVSKGTEDYRSEEVVAANYDESDGFMYFHLDSGAMLALDTRHPTPDQPAGRWQRWDSDGLLVAAGATIDPDGNPAHLEQGGAIRTPGAGYQDATASTPVDVLMSWETGDLAAAGKLEGPFRIDALRFQGEWLATHTLRFTLTSNYGALAPSVHTSAALTAAPCEAFMRPRGHERVKATRVKVEELSSTGRGFKPTGFVMTIQRYPSASFPSNSRRVA